MKRHGADRIIGFSPIPAMSYLSYAAGSRFLQLFGGVNMSFYDWYADLPEELRPVVKEEFDGQKYDIMPQIAQALTVRVKAAFTGARITEIPSPGERGAVRLQIADGTGRYVGFILMRASNTSPRLSRTAQGKNQATLRQL